MPGPRHLHMDPAEPPFFAQKMEQWSWCLLEVMPLGIFFRRFFGKKMIEERSIKASEISMDWSEKNMHFSHKELPKTTVEKKLDFLASKASWHRKQKEEKMSQVSHCSPTSDLSLVQGTANCQWLLLAQASRVAALPSRPVLETDRQHQLLWETTLKTMEI